MKTKPMIEKTCGESPNENKLSDGGGTAQPVPGSVAEAQDVTARSRSLQRMVRPISLALPKVETKFAGVRKSGEGCDSVVSVKDSIRAVIEHEHSRGRNTTGLRAYLSELDKSVLAVGDSGKAVVNSAPVAVDQAVHDKFRLWMEANIGEGAFTEMPREVCDRFDALMVEQSLPYTSVSGRVLRHEGPSVIGDKFADIHDENLVRHVSENLPCCGDVHNGPNDIKISYSGGGRSSCPDSGREQEI